MKKFIVLQILSTLSPIMKECFDEKDDAYAFAELLKRAHPNFKFIVCETIWTL